MDAENPTTATQMSIRSLPNEILVQIFRNKSLSNKDLTNAQLACRLFKDNIESFVTSNRHYIFRVDEVSQPTWKLIRHLINNPELKSGHQIVSITVKWHRRIAKSEDTWTKSWFWRESEIQELKSLCYKYEFTDEIKHNILHGGKNSEALLPLLLRFTPNLRSLDLGNIDGRIVDDTEANCVQSLSALGCHWYSSPEREYRNERESCEAKRSLFLFEHLQPWNLPPELRGIRYVSMSCKDGVGSRHSERTLSIILLLPNVERIQVSYSTNGEYRDGYTPSYDFGFKKTSPVKYLDLEIIGTGGHSTYYFFSVAEMTGNLTSVNIRRKYKSGDITKTLEGDEEIARKFLECNKTTIQKSEIYINGGGFDDDGVYDVDAERRRMVLRKQRLFELARSRGLRSNPPSPFIALKPLLLSHIIPFLTRTDVFNLMLSCKTLKDICQQNLWSIFIFRPEDIKNHPLEDRYLTVDNWLLLEKRLQKYGTEDIKYLERLDVGDEVFSLGDGDIHDIKACERRVFMVFLDQLRNGSTSNLKLVNIRLSYYGRSHSDSPDFPYHYGFMNFHDPFGAPPRRPPSPVPSSDCKEFLTLIQNHSKLLPVTSFSLHLTVHVNGRCSSDPLALMGLCDLTKLKRLHLIGKRCRDLEETALQLDRLVEIVSMVSSSSSNQQPKSLEIEAFYNHDGHFDESDDESPGNLENPQEKLAALQNLVFGLTGLKELKTKDRIFDPSFILLPPPSVKCLSYTVRDTPPSWWETFSKFSFSGVEYLTLISGYRPSYARLTALKNIQLSSLREIITTDDAYNIYSAYYPPGFINTIVNNNPGLSKSCLQTIADQKAKACRDDISWKIPDIVKLCSEELEGMIATAVAGYAKKLIDGVAVEKKGVLNEEFDAEVSGKVVGLVVEEFEKVMIERFAEKCREIVRDKLQGKGEEEK
ncbi:hypothetical protein TWF506_011318 [Arthrobotrys conoides]|uniref:F-box domain-containing protein n=1 Tax=Arthrobotrys conoides TaxID=74498 RepID=A0AAN8NGM6_9PEZI